MKSIGEQLASLFLDDEDARKPANAPSDPIAPFTPSITKAARTSRRRSDSLELGLAMLGTISRIDPERGFGFIVPHSGVGEIFFHIKGRRGRRDHSAQLPPVATQVLFVPGSDVRKGKNRVAACWLPVADMPRFSALSPLTQSTVDSLRRAELGGLDWTSLCALLHADWYSKLWNYDTPADLADPILEEVLKARVATLAPDELKGNALWETLARALYEFAARWEPSNPHHAFDLTLFSIPQLLALGAPREEWMHRAGQALRMRLMEWHLFSRGVQDEQEDWSAWFAGADPSEADLANSALEAGLAPDAFIADWIGALAAKGAVSQSSLDKWLRDKPQLALHMFEKLSPKQQAQQLRDWRRMPGTLSALQPEPGRFEMLLALLALAVDLETDGERIWEVGCAQRGVATRLYQEDQGSALGVALSQLVGLMSAAAVVVGHNLLAWDWPIIQRATDCKQAPLIWDTLLVQFLIEPQAPSHALGGNHHADGDALATADLFRRQLSLLPGEFAKQVLLGEFADAQHLLDGMARAMEGRAHYSREGPAALMQAVHPGRVQIMARHQIRAFDWVPDVIVVPVDPSAGLPLELCQIDVEQLARELAADPSPSPATVTVLGVARNAAAQRISLRRNMIPLWLTDGDSMLSQALDRSCVTPSGTGRRIAAMPETLAWWRTADLTGCTLVRSDTVMILPDRTGSCSGDPGELWQDRSMTSLVRVMNEGNATHWAVPDRAAHVLEPRGGIRPFATWPVDVAVDRQTTADSEALATRAVVATRRHHVLYPHSCNQAGYWQEVLRTCREVSQRQVDATVILLIGSSESADLVRLLETGLAEIGMGEVRPLHRSSREHLRRASRKGYAVVDVLANWPKWKSIAESAQVLMQPVVEALPVEHWYACEQAQQEHMAARLVDTATDDPSQACEPAVLPQAVSTTNILEVLPALVSSHLAAWLSTEGFGPGAAPAVLIDPRLAPIARSLAAQVDLLILNETSLSPDEEASLDIVLSPFRLVREEAPSDYASMEQFLIRHWQSDGNKGGQAPGFKPTQREPMEAIRNRSSHVLVSLPTGEGKSVLFQVPALCRGLRNRRLTLVISPLKALMRDQVEGLRDLSFGVSADFLSSDLSVHEVSEVIQGVLDHRIVLLYVAPERLRSPVFLAALRKRMGADKGLEYVVVDEAHCVNQWGYEFRPDYFHATDLLLRESSKWHSAEPTPFLLMSATVTASDKERLAAFLAGDPGERKTLPFLARPDTFAHPIRSHIAIRPQRVSGRASGRELGEALAARLPFIVAAIAQAKRNAAETGQRSAVIIFVQSRSLAELLAEQLVEETGVNAGFYHAGLDAAAREETYSDFRQGELDVLVATKAFGMGMDIPDIHWALHFSPPGYLEDYLQEVGRIGRGAAQREKAGLKTLSAMLPYSDHDFEQIRNLRARNALSRPAIEEAYAQIRARAASEDGRLVSIVPAHGYERFGSETEQRAATTRMRMALYWLERAGKLILCSSLPDVMSIDLLPDVLNNLTAQTGPVGELARLLLGLERPVVSANPEPADPGQSRLRRLLEGLADKIGLAFARPSNSHLPLLPPRTVEPPALEAVINLSQIRLQSKTMNSNDDVLAALTDLETRGGVSLYKDVEFKLRRLAKSTDVEIAMLFDLVNDAAGVVVTRLGEGSGRFTFDPTRLIDLGPLIDPLLREAEEEQSQAETDTSATLRNREQFRAAYTSGLRSLLRASGIKLRQIVMPDETVLWEAILAPSNCGNVARRRKDLVSGAQSLFAVIRSSRDKIAVSRLVDSVRAASAKNRFSQHDLKCTAGLLSALKLVSISVEINGFSHLVLLQADQDDTDGTDAVWDDLNEINDLAEVRNQAMEIFANLRPDAQESFIAGYFSKPNSGELKAFLETQLGEIEEVERDHGSNVIAEMQERLRATKAVELFDRFRQSEEPAQWEAVSHPYDRHLLVNAGPGAGKTFVLVGRIVHLIREQRIQPSQIIVLAFNRAVVFEIRRRIRELFKSLGYAAYASRLRVSTIHSFALRHLGRAGLRDPDADTEDTLAEFARRMESDQGFRRTVAGDVRCILVDEFQDVTEQIYTILRNLHLGSDARAGLMVIGDDDQDILRWNRPAGEFSEKYFDRFVDDFGGESLKQLLLAVNFRSVGDVVSRSQKMISGFFAENTRSRRLKTSVLTARRDAPEHGDGQRFDWSGQSLEEAIEMVPSIWRDMDAADGQTLAILCRSNAEVAQTHRLLQPHIPGICVQGTANLRIADLRHQALWLDFLRRQLEDRDPTLSEDLKVQLVGEFRQATVIPECVGAQDTIDSIETLWDLCCQEREFPRVSTLIRFVEEMRSDDLVRLSGGRANSSSVIVSTIHKVKGLEFDNVIILPSIIRFGSGGRNPMSDLSGAAAEEARLLYVAMTRAKRGLWHFVGTREKAWGRRQPVPFESTQMQDLVLTGSLEEVDLGWANRQGDFNPDPAACQSYIEKVVRVGDPIFLGGLGSGGGKSLMHRDASGRLRQVGFVAKKYGMGSRDAELKASAVIRFFPDAEGQESSGAQEGRRTWGYVVLVSGRLR